MAVAILPVPKSIRKNLTGRRFGRLVVLGYTGRNSAEAPLWLCQCDCGKQKVCLGYSLLCGVTASCNCFRADLVRKRTRAHGLTKTRTYRTWSGMIARCTRKQQPDYLNYGGRGIRVCERWRD